MAPARATALGLLLDHERRLALRGRAAQREGGEAQRHRPAAPRRRGGCRSPSGPSTPPPRCVVPWHRGPVMLRCNKQAWRAEFPGSLRPRCAGQGRAASPPAGACCAILLAALAAEAGLGHPAGRAPGMRAVRRHRDAVPPDFAGDRRPGRAPEGRRLHRRPPAHGRGAPACRAGGGVRLAGGRARRAARPAGARWRPGHLAQRARGAGLRRRRPGGRRAVPALRHVRDRGPVRLQPHHAAALRR